MPTTQTRSQEKSKATSKDGGCGVIVADKPTSENAPARTNPTAGISAQERETLIARAAYFRAEKRGFVPGGELQDWVEAEAEVRRLIAAD